MPKEPKQQAAGAEGLLGYQTLAEPKAWAAGTPVFCAHDKIVPVGKLQPNPRNPNQHPLEQIKLLAEIIRAQGWRGPITVSNRSGLIVRGHGRLKAALMMDAGEVPVDYQNYASEAEEWADLVADNRIAEFAEIDRSMLAELLSEIDTGEFPLLLSGYTEEEYGSLVTSLSESNVLMDITDDIAPEPPEEPVTAAGDVWYIGEHVLICGDSTKPETYEKLLDGEKAELVITDPPYNVALGMDETPEEAKKRRRRTDRLTVQNDKQTDGDFREFLRTTFSLTAENSEKGAAAYIFHADSESYNFRGAFVESGYALKQCLIWVKNTFALGRQDYHWRHEPILYGWLEGRAHYFIDDRKQSTVYEEPEPDFDAMKKGGLLAYIKERIAITETNTTAIYEDKPVRSYLHPTMKPVRLVARLVNNSSKPRQIVLDPFAGSGSTLLACEHLKRRARVAEVDPRYCDVIVKRYTSITGKTDVRCIRDGRELSYSEIEPLLAENETEGGDGS